MENERLLSELFAQYDIAKETRTDFLKRLNAARDKWWVEQIERFKSCGFGTYDSVYGDIMVTGNEWQSLKLSLQSSAALTNLMGKFPDLPDVTEVKK